MAQEAGATTSSEAIPTHDRIEEINLDDSDPKKCVGIGADLDTGIQESLIKFLKANIDTFPWSIHDMVGISLDVISHKLNVDPTFKPVKQKRRKLGAERAKAVFDEVKKLLEARLIIEVQYPD